VANADDGGLAAGVEEAAATLVDDPATFPADGDGVIFAEIAREEGGVGRHDDRGIVADEKDSDRCQEITIAPRRGSNAAPTKNEAW
jgi:hypothetical protein